MARKTITQRVVDNARRRGVVVRSRPAWGSNPVGRGWPLAPDVDNVYAWRRKHKPVRSPADTLVQHITVTFDSGELVGDFAADMRTIERIGFERFGSGFSYNFGVDMRTGMVGVGMPLDAKGTHTVNDKGVPGYSYDLNLTARAIAVVGMPGDLLSRRAERSIVLLSAAMVEEGALTRGYDYDPHSLFAPKDCPCAPTRDRMEAIRRAVADLVRNDRND